MSTQDLNNSLDSLGKAIVDLTNAPSPAPEINDRSLSGNKIHGGMITNFSSRGISDQATRMIVLVNDDGITVDAIDVDTISGGATVTGDMTVDGLLTAKTLHVNEITADLRAERAESLEFVGEQTSGKGLIWRSNEYSKQLMYYENPDRIFVSEHLDLARTKYFSIGTVPVITENSLGTGIINSNLNSLGVLNELTVNGNVQFDDFLFWEASANRLGLGTESPNGTISVLNDALDSEFIIDGESTQGIRIGNWTNSDLHMITDDTIRLTIKANGNIVVGTQGANNASVNIHGRLGLGVTNLDADVSLSTSGPIKIEGKKMQSGSSAPSNGSYNLGDIVWNNNPQPTGYVGWICIREGTPGIWKPFGTISS